MGKVCVKRALGLFVGMQFNLSQFVERLWRPDRCGLEQIAARWANRQMGPQYLHITTSSWGGIRADRMRSKVRNEKCVYDANAAADATRKSVLACTNDALSHRCTRYSEQYKKPIDSKLYAATGGDFSILRTKYECTALKRQTQIVKDHSPKRLWNVVFFYQKSTHFREQSSASIIFAYFNWDIHG